MSLFRTFVLLTCFNGALSRVPDSLPDRSKTPDVLWSFMEETYGHVSHYKPAPDAGSPLFLTPYIAAKKLQEAREAARVDSAYLLPDMESFAGYLTVNKKYNSNLWFWYFPVSGRKVEETPWIIWLQGGPGASSMFGLFTEIGPFFVTANNTLEEMKYSWGKNHSLLFIDNPVGTGYSFTDDEHGYATNQTTVGENLYNALQQFLTIFPELRKAPLTIAGESYAGKYIPTIGVQILRNRQKDEPINLQGLAIGNGWIDPLTMQRYSYFVREVGLVDDKVADMVEKYESVVIRFLNNKQNLYALSYYNDILSAIMRHSNLPNIYNYLQDKIDLKGPWVDFIQRTEIRNALHVGNISFSFHSKVVYEHLTPDFMISSKMDLEELLDNYKVMVYNGHLDIIVAYHPSVNTYNSLNFSGSTNFKNSARLPWKHDGSLAGYYRVAANLTEVMVRGAGHMVPADKPAAALGLMSAFIRGTSLDKDTASLLGESNEVRKRQLSFKFP